MNPKTKEAYKAMLSGMAESYSVDTVTEIYNVDPTVEQELLDAIIKSDAFLSRINMLYVDEIKGQKVMGSANVVKGKRTDTTANDRIPENILNLGSKDFELFNTEFDFAMPYATIDAWAKFKDFHEKYGTWTRNSIALSRLRTGWMGAEAAAVTSTVDKAMGEDTNKGWFQLLRDYNAGSQFLTAGAINIGSAAGNNYVNIDSAVHDLLQLIAPEHRSMLEVFVGEDLMADEKARLYAAHGGTPTEKERSIIESSVTTFAGLARGVTPSFFPGKGIMITDPRNLSIYIQSGSVRRQQMDNPKRSQVEDYNSANEGYVIENENACAAMDYSVVKTHNGTDWV